MYEVVDVISVEVVEGFRVRLVFEDGVEGMVDLSHHLEGPVLGSLRKDYDLFRSVRVDRDAGTIVWPNGADIAPDTLYQEALAVAGIRTRYAGV